MASCNRIGELVIRIQEHFLDTPHLAVTSSQPRAQLAVDADTCEAILASLADAEVLTRSRGGHFVRHFPQALSTHVGSDS
jgi:hypothetical protein